MKTFKQLKIFTLLLFSVAMVTFSCKSDDDGGDGGSAAAGTIQAKVNGSNFQASGQLATAVYVSAGQTLTIYGTDMSGRNINLIVNGFDGSPGTYEIGGENLIFVVGTYTEASVSGSQSWVAPYEGSGVVGEISISEFSSTGSVKGTFRFRGRNQNDTSSFKEITDGAFNLSVQNY